MNFLKNIISSAIGFMVAAGFLIIFTVVVVVVLGSDNEVKVSENSILRLELNKEIKDFAPMEIDPFAQILGLPPQYLGLNEILSAIEKAKSDPRIKGISIEGDLASGGITQLFAIRNAIVDFKYSGKPVFAYADTYGQREYFLSSVADSVFVSPVGQVELKGLTSEILFFKDFQDKYGIKMEVIRHGKYKSAVEPFIANKMSESNRIQIKELLGSLWFDMVDAISLSRGLSVDGINEIADGLLGRTSERSLKNNLVDGVLYKDEYKEKLKNIISVEKYETTRLIDYIQSNMSFDFEANSDAAKIAVIYAQGDIIYGEGDEESIGQGMMVKAINKAAKNDAIKAIVLRVNSPGGSALASDLIWRALETAKKEKPLVVSMGDYAASGGYYISCNADSIFAESATVTGSIGVFGILPNASEFTNKIGIYSEKVNTNNSPSYSPFSKLDPKFHEVTKESVDQIYKTFVSKVAKGRGMSFDEVDQLAQGRVWTGKQAKENGLIDAVGSLENAISSAALLAEIEDYKIENYPKYEKDIRESFRKMPFMNLKEDLMKEWLGDANFILFKQLNTFKSVEGIQMGLPYLLKIK
ncbi:signal peptide peptidase SppA [Flavicella sp.]|uniref:signal peptide peptidase SppA n=1 Tax=Flavicella sp. TaxID=2957742 RepID=UPI00301824FD